MGESKLNLSAISAYADLVGQKIGGEYFQSKNVIAGQDIVNLSSIKQVNYFVLKELFSQWQTEIARLESPFFDYKNEDVKSAMQSLMNVLSKNILVKEDDFQPLLSKAIAETLFLILSPYDYFHSNLEKAPSLSFKFLHSQLKYFKINRHLYMLLLEQLESRQQGQLSLDEVGHVLDGIFKSTAEGPEDIDAFIQSFAQLVPLQVEDFFKDDVELSPKEEEEIDDIQNHLFQDFEEMDELAIEKSKQQLNDRYASEVKTINEKLAAPTMDIATSHESKPVESILKSISINQRYRFIKELFDGNTESFENAIEEIEDCPTFENAVGHLVQNYARDNHWNMQSTEIKDFLKVIIKKFK